MVETYVIHRDIQQNLGRIASLCRCRELKHGNFFTRKWWIDGDRMATEWDIMRQWHVISVSAWRFTNKHGLLGRPWCVWCRPSQSLDWSKTRNQHERLNYSLPLRLPLHWHPMRFNLLVMWWMNRDDFIPRLVSSSERDARIPVSQIWSKSLPCSRRQVEL